MTYRGRPILSGSDQVKIDRPLNFDSLQQETVNFVFLGSDKIERAVNFDWCRDGQNWPGPYLY